MTNPQQEQPWKPTDELAAVRASLSFLEDTTLEESSISTKALLTCFKELVKADRSTADIAFVATWLIEAQDGLVQHPWAQSLSDRYTFSFQSKKTEGEVLVGFSLPKMANPTNILNMVTWKQQEVLKIEDVYTDLPSLVGNSIDQLAENNADTGYQVRYTVKNLEKRKGSKDQANNFEELLCHTLSDSVELTSAMDVVAGMALTVHQISEELLSEKPRAKSSDSPVKELSKKVLELCPALEQPGILCSAGDGRLALVALKPNGIAVELHNVDDSIGSIPPRAIALKAEDQGESSLLAQIEDAINNS